MADKYTYSGNVYKAAAAGTTKFALTSTEGNSILYLQKAHIHVYRSTDSGVSWTEKARPADWDFDDPGTSIVLTSGIADGEWVWLLRKTPIKNRFVDFADGSLLTAEQLDQGEDFSRFVDQEMSDKYDTLQTQAIKYLGAIDLTTDDPPASPDGGDFYINTGSGKVKAGWTGIVGDDVVGSEQVIYNSNTDEWEIGQVPSSQTGVIEVKVTAPITRDVTDPQRPIIGIQASSDTEDGSMSKEDKAKLDSIDTSAGGIITDAPNDGKQYCRESQAWAQVDIPPGTIIQATAPTSADKGQLWFNTTDNRLYIATDDTPTWVETSPVVAPMTVGASAPASPGQGTLWYDTNTGRAYVYIDGTTKAWVDQNPGGGGGTTKGGGQNLVFQENEMICTEDYQLTAGRSALSAGPITIQTGKTITIPNNQSWVIL